MFICDRREDQRSLLRLRLGKKRSQVSAFSRGRESREKRTLVLGWRDHQDTVTLPRELAIEGSDIGAAEAIVVGLSRRDEMVNGRLKPKRTREKEGTDEDDVEMGLHERGSDGQGSQGTQRDHDLV